MARRNVVAVVAVALLIGSLTACSGGDPSTAPPTASSADPNKPRSVPDPIEPKAFIENPCTSLTGEQQKKFHLDSGEVILPGRRDQYCTYHYTDVDRHVNVGYDGSGDEVASLVLSNIKKHR
jgi:predicted small lipoprotein YifL